MTTSAKFLAFDLGATSGRAIVGGFEEGRFAMEEIHRFPNGAQEIEGRFHWNTDELFAHLKEGLRKAAAAGYKIESIGIDTWGVDFGCIGADGKLLAYPRAYRDPYTEGIPEEVFSIIPREELYSVTGIQIMNFNTIFQLYAQKKAGYEPLLKADKILFMPDLLSYLLTGSMVCEYTDASTSGLMNQRTRQFEKPFLERLGINPGILPEIVQPGTKVGLLKPEIAAETGIGQVPVIAVAGHDTASAIAAVPASNPHFAYLSSGTWSLMGLESPHPLISDETCRLNFTNEGGIEGTTRFLKNITGMWLLEQSRKVWARDGRTYSYAQIEKMANEAEGYKGIIDPDDPSLANPANMVKAISELLWNSNQSIPVNDAEMIRCIYQSLAAKYKEVLGILQEQASFSIDTLHVIGGGSANDTMSRLTAEATGIKVVAGPTEATAIGNLMMQAKAAGIVKDRWEMREIISREFKVKSFKI
ncbi:MAG: rhamnulokinase [Bacteroidales bacterium]|nr:rhamnulokinase [Bacteroidales bacterium]